MNIKTALIIGAAILVAAIILSNEDTANMEYQNETYSYENDHSEGSQPTAKQVNYTNEKPSKEEIVMKPMMDPARGIPFAHYPLPTTWKIKSDGWYGPHNLKIKVVSSKQMNMAQQRYQSPSQLIAGEIGQMIKQGAGRIIKQTPLNQIANRDQEYTRLISTSNQIQTQNEAIGINVDINGKREYCIVKTAITSSHYGGLWNYTLITLEADPSYVNQAAKHLTYALANFKPNMQRVAMYKTEENNKAQASWAAHNNRMRSNQRSFDATNKAYLESSKATNDAIMGVYKSSSESFDRTNQMTTNSIYGENTVTNPYDGTSYQTSDVYDRTFMNAFGEQIQTNDQFYQPGMDYNAQGYEEVYPNGGY